MVVGRDHDGVGAGAAALVGFGAALCLRGRNSHPQQLHLQLLAGGIAGFVLTWV